MNGTMQDGTLMRCTTQKINDREMFRSLLPNREGNALVVTLLLTLSLSGLVLGALMSTQTETRLTSNHSMRQKTFYLAERGVEAELETVEPVVSPVVWTSLATG